MKFRGKGFTLVEMLVAIAIGSMALTGMFSAVMSYMRIWKEVSGTEQNKKFNQDTITRRFLLNELSSILANLATLKASDEITFRKLDGSKAVQGSDDLCFYWQSSNKLPFLKKDEGGITECWLKCEGSGHSTEGDGKNQKKELRLYYRSLKPGQTPNFSGESGNAKDYVVLHEGCKEINFGYMEEASSPNIKFSNVPKFKDGANPDLPEMIQILVGDETPV